MFCMQCKACKTSTEKKPSEDAKGRQVEKTKSRATHLFFSRRWYVCRLIDGTGYLDGDFLSQCVYVMSGKTKTVYSRHLFVENGNEKNGVSPCRSVFRLLL